MKSHIHIETHQMAAVGTAAGTAPSPHLNQLNVSAIVAVVIAVPLTIVLGIATKKKYRFWQRQQRIKQLERMWSGATESKKE